MANNPFSMTFGIEPANLINRIKETDKITKVERMLINEIIFINLCSLKVMIKR